MIGNVRDCGSSTLPTLHEAARRQATGVSGDLDFGGLREARARRLSASGT